MLLANLDDGTTALAGVAEVARVSTRSPHRKFVHVGLSCSDMLDTVGYENASRLLRYSGCRIVDVAFPPATPILRISAVPSAA